MKKYTVYKHISPSNKVYIGITTEININKRWKNGKSVGKLNGKKLKWIFLKGNILLNFSHNKIYRTIN
jgi:hypothetical protein